MNTADKIELVVLRNLLYNADYIRRVLPFVKEEYFHDPCERRLFKSISDFIQKYASSPTAEALNIILSEQDGVAQGEYDECAKLISTLLEGKDISNEIAWLIDQTEKFCKDKAVYNALMESIQLLDDKKSAKSGKSRNAIPEILTSALSVSFDASIGHDFVEDADSRFEFYHRVEQKMPFDLDFFNKITGGGVPSKTLNIILAGCVHPDTKVKIRYQKRIWLDDVWMESEIKISGVNDMLNEGHIVQVDSPDGYVPVSLFVDKGTWKEYVLNTDDGTEVRCNENHLFETSRGWILAKHLVDTDFMVLTKNGFVRATVTKTGHDIPIVDIQVNHEKHRYYTNGVSSHNTGVGKSLFMCHHAASCLAMNKNVLYITLEMAEERIAERIDANMMDIAVDDLKSLTKEVYDRKLARATQGLTGKLIIKEYPTATANVDHFRHLLDELRLKKNFKPDILFVDYLNICASSRFKAGANVNSYTYVKAIAEELRGLAVQSDFPIFSATQTNRSGFGNTDVELTDTSESFGLPATADLMFAIIATEELDGLGQIMVKQLKNRYNDPTTHKRFVVGIDRPKMKLFDVEEKDQKLFESLGKKDEDDEDETSKFQTGKKRSFSGWG
jgi:hypothetical protein